MIEFKVSDWIIVDNKHLGQFKRFTKDLPEWNKNLDYENVEFLNGERFHVSNFDRSIVRSWKPKVGEYCVFTDDNISEYLVKKYVGVKDNVWDTIEPLEAVMLLKDK